MTVREPSTKDPTTRIPSAFSEFGSYLRTCRKRAGTGSQRAAVRALESRKVKVSQGRLAQYETGRVRDPAPDVLAALASLYGVDFFEVTLRLARAKFESVAGREALVAPGRWDLVEAALAPITHIGSAPDLEAHQVRARAALFREVDILDVEGLASWERSFEGLETFWVVAPHSLEDEDDRLHSAVAANLKRGVRYTYFTHPDRKARFEALQEKLQAQIGSRPRVEKVAQAVWIPPEALPFLHADYLVANATVHSGAVGFQILRRDGKARFALRLPDPELLDLIDKVAAWRATLRERS